MPPPSASLQSSSPTPTPALQQTVDQIIARRGATETSTDKTAEQISENAAKEDLRTFKNAFETPRAGEKVSPPAPDSPSIPSFAEQVFPQLSYLMRERSSCFELHFYSERTLAERQAGFHRRLCARLEDVGLAQQRFQEWLAVRVKLGMLSPNDCPKRPLYTYPDTPLLLASPLEPIDDEFGDAEENGFRPQSAEAAERESNLEVPQGPASEGRV